MGKLSLSEIKKKIATRFMQSLVEPVTLRWAEHTLGDGWPSRATAQPQSQAATPAAVKKDCPVFS